ncbi:ComF family protein [Staphylococcus edaphicus]|uniref:Amidophosphoribosyltransferase n=1 Tax=Staphylococcus edaphicus TaxID=1955013 RepID=A0A2C6WNC2_9STAP|nr:ComF family protein [Staphylococcus edaphicus]PHK49266.1 amidophosphoribosyltransferase [Staphylococcus edaphicus]UQW81029.1 ComF family protein [Staphylococcus edaphicus]
MARCIQCDHNIIETFNALNFYKKSLKICENCLQQWEENKITTDGRCPRCLKLLEQDEHDCLDCAFLATKFQLMNQLYCQYQYKGVVKQLIHQYKFLKDVAICEILADRLRLPTEQYDLIIPVPSPLERDINRTFNPVVCVLDKKKVPYLSILQTHVRPKQSLLGKLHRARLDNPFEISKNINLEDKNILLVDDIYTTGLTVHHAIDTLYVRKIRKFDVFTFAR